MNILIIGSGGREHALAWKISQSPNCQNLFITPGNAGTALHGTNVKIAANDFDNIIDLCVENKIDMVVVGPEDPLVKGLYEEIQIDDEIEDIMFIGPDSKGAQLEGSKAFAKAFMQKYNIPTADHREFTLKNFDEGISYIQMQQPPIVIKADGLAAGKGVIIAPTVEHAIETFTEMLQQRSFGDASSKVVIEQYLNGIEMSVFALTDGKDYVLLPEAKDYKRIGVGDTGLNTGGMGAISPVPFFDDALKQKVIEKIVEPTIKGIEQEGFYYTGFVFFGLMICNNEPYVIEYNCRLGDPETEVVLPRIEDDFLALLLAAAKGRLKDQTVKHAAKAAATIVAVSGGYPGHYEKDKIISGLENETASIVFHAGTVLSGEEVATNGGRVLAVTSLGNTISEAVQHSAQTLEAIDFDGMYYRNDIGYEFKEA